MISIPFFDVDTYISSYVTYESGLNTLYRIKKYNFNNQINGTVPNEMYNFSKTVYLNKSNKDGRTPIIAMWVDGDYGAGEDSEFSWFSSNPDNLRDDEQEQFFVYDDGVYTQYFHFTIYFNIGTCSQGVRWYFGEYNT